MPARCAADDTAKQRVTPPRRATPQAAIEAACNTCCYLPAYAPDFNPIEMLFAQLKTSLRRASAPTFDTFVDAIGAELNHITRADIHARLRHCGSTLTAAAEA